MPKTRSSSSLCTPNHTPGTNPGCGGGPRTSGPTPGRDGGTCTPASACQQDQDFCAIYVGGGLVSPVSTATHLSNRDQQCFLGRDSSRNSNNCSVL